MVTQKKLWNQKDRAPPNYVGRIRSNLNFEVIWWVKKSKNSKIAKNCKIVFGFFWRKYWSQRAENLYGLSLHYCVYKCYFIKISVSWKKSKIKVVPPRRTTRTTTTSTVPWSGLRRRQKQKELKRGKQWSTLSVVLRGILLLRGRLIKTSSSFSPWQIFREMRSCWSNE